MNTPADKDERLIEYARSILRAMKDNGYTGTVWDDVLNRYENAIIRPECGARIYTKEDAEAMCELAIAGYKKAAGIRSTYDVVADAVQEVADAADDAFRKAGLEPGEWDGDDIVKDVSRGIAHDIERLHSALSTKQEPDGYAVLLDDAAAPKGFWFVAAYHSKEQADAIAKRNGKSAGYQPIYFAPVSTSVALPLVKRISAQRDELYDAAVALLAHYDTTDNAENFERDVAALKAAVAKVPSYEQRLTNIFAACAEDEGIVSASGASKP